MLTWTILCLPRTALGLACRLTLSSLCRISASDFNQFGIDPCSKKNSSVYTCSHHSHSANSSSSVTSSNRELWFCYKRISVSYTLLPSIYSDYHSGNCKDLRNNTFLAYMFLIIFPSFICCWQLDVILILLRWNIWVSNTALKLIRN